MCTRQATSSSALRLFCKVSSLKFLICVQKSNIGTVARTSLWIKVWLRVLWSRYSLFSEKVILLQANFSLLIPMEFTPTYDNLGINVCDRSLISLNEEKQKFTVWNFSIIKNGSHSLQSSKLLIKNIIYNLILSALLKMSVFKTGYCFHSS